MLWNVPQKSAVRGAMWGEDNKREKKIRNTELDTKKTKTKNDPNLIDDNISCSSPLGTLSYLPLPTFWDKLL